MPAQARVHDVERPYRIVQVCSTCYEPAYHDSRPTLEVDLIHCQRCGRMGLGTYPAWPVEAPSLYTGGE